jgi:hypothetical protein
MERLFEPNNIEPRPQLPLGEVGTLSQQRVFPSAVDPPSGEHAAARPATVNAALTPGTALAGRAAVCSARPGRRRAGR